MEELKLLKVKRLPTLVNGITGIADKTTIDPLKTGVQFLPEMLYSKASIAHALMYLDTEVADENSVTRFYERTTATFCLPVASILALGIPGLLMWSQSGNGSGYAIADGCLRFAGPAALTEREKALKAVDKETLEPF